MVNATRLDGESPLALPRPGPSRGFAGTAGHAAAGPPDAAAFSTVEESHAYVARLLEAVEETARGVGEDLRRMRPAGGRRREALQVVAYKLDQLRFHLAVSRRRLGELRALRLILDGDGPGTRATIPGKGEAA